MSKQFIIGGVLIPIFIAIPSWYFFKADIKPKSGFLPKQIAKDNKFSIEIENRGTISKAYRLELSSSFLSFKQNPHEHDDAKFIPRPDNLTWYPVDLGGGKTHVHNVEIDGLEYPENYDSMNSNAYMELKIVDAHTNKELFLSKCYYSLEITGGIMPPRYANFENPVLDTTGNAEKHRAECKIL